MINGQMKEVASVSEKNTLTVRINNQEYTIASQESREYMLSVADVVDKHMKQISRANPALSTTLTAVLASLNLADEYVRLKRAHAKLSNESATAIERIRQLEEQLAKQKRY